MLQRTPWLLRAVVVLAAVTEVFRLVSSGAAAQETAAPAGVRDPSRSVWLELTDPPTEHGLKTRASNEGVYRAVVVGGVTAMTVDPAQGRYLYLQVDPWFTPPEAELTVAYFDSGTGTVGVVYDSLDETVRAEERFPGAWKRVPEVIQCEGTNRWRRAVLCLPDARFARCCNDADIRLELAVEGDFPISAISLTAVTDQEPQPAQLVQIVGADGGISSHEPRVDERYTLRADGYELAFSADGLVELVDASRRARLTGGGAAGAFAAFAVRKVTCPRELEVRLMQRAGKKPS